MSERRAILASLATVATGSIAGCAGFLDSAPPTNRPLTATAQFTSTICEGDIGKPSVRWDDTEVAVTATADLPAGCYDISGETHGDSESDPGVFIARITEDDEGRCIECDGGVQFRATVEPSSVNSLRVAYDAPGENGLYFGTFERNSSAEATESTETA